MKVAGVGSKVGRRALDWFARATSTTAALPRVSPLVSAVKEQSTGSVWVLGSDLIEDSKE
jgi:hypothetical protein